MPVPPHTPALDELKRLFHEGEVRDALLEKSGGEPKHGHNQDGSDFVIEYQPPNHVKPEDDELIGFVDRFFQARGCKTQMEKGNVGLPHILVVHARKDENGLYLFLVIISTEKEGVIRIRYEVH